MIFGFIVKAIKVIFDGFVRLCAFLLVTLGLWLPAVYSLFFLIVCAIAGIPLKGATTTVYIVGLVISFIACVWLSILRFDRRKKKERERRTKKNQGGGIVKRREYAPAEDFLQKPSVEAEEDYYPQSEYTTAPPQEDKKKSAKEELYGQTKPQATYEDFEDLKAKYLAGDAGTQSNPAQNSAWQYQAAPAAESATKVDVEPSYDYLGLSDPISREQLERRLMGVETNEKPMTFAMRSDPDIIVYEYSDRLKYYRKTKRGLIHLYTEFKK